MNLIMNAGQAIEKEGEIRIRTLYDSMENKAVIQVTDTGRGIDPGDLNRIFDPFFTTKPVGKGTGLGLSVSYGIIHEHGGEIQVQSKKGSGATFTVFLPMEPKSTNNRFSKAAKE